MEDNFETVVTIEINCDNCKHTYTPFVKRCDECKHSPINKRTVMVFDMLECAVKDKCKNKYNEIMCEICKYNTKQRMIDNYEEENI